jgi:putative ABC transport system ATP-binding protein
MENISSTITNTTDPIIYTQALKRDYRMGSTTVQALRGVDLSVEAGEFVALMGPSGCGKSTLLHIIGCLDTPTSGIYSLEGREVGSLSTRQRAQVRGERIGFVFQNFFLLPNLDALENVALPLQYGRESRQARKRAAEALDQVGLSDRMKHRPNELSGGQRQRVAIARALVNKPAILLADEPTGNLDSDTGAEMLALLSTLWKNGLSILLVTHDSQVSACAQRVVRMRDGRIVEGVPA